MGLSQERYLELQKQFLEIRGLKTERHCKILDYGTYDEKSDEPYNGSRMRVVEDASTGVNELLNWTNHFAKVIEDCDAWAEVLRQIRNEDERFSTLFEIVSPISFLALSFPAAIKGKLIFVCARMLRDTFKIKKSDGNLLDDHLLTKHRLEALNNKITDLSLKNEVECFIETLAEIDSTYFREITSNYRNRANHAIAPYIEFGERMAFAPILENGKEGFTFGVEKAIKLNTLIEPLVEQHSICTTSIKAFLPVLLTFRKRWKVV